MDFFSLPFFEDKLPPLTFLLLLFEVELITLVTLPVELVLDIVVESLDAFALALFAAVCMFDTV